MERSMMIRLVCLLISTLLIAIDATSVIFAVPSILADLQGNATESFWIGGSYLLAMCISQPIMASMSDVFGCKGVILASILMLGGGSLIGEDAQSMDLLLVGRSVQGLGAGGLTVSSYLTYGSLPLKIGDKFLTAVSFSIAVGTVCGPFFGAMLSHSSTWRWIFRLNIPLCVILGIFVYNTGNTIQNPPTKPVKLSDLDLVAATLSITSVASLLIGLSLVGSLYEWTDWQPIVLIALGCFSFFFLVGRELYPVSSWSAGGRKSCKPRRFLGLNSLNGPESVSIILGALFLGVLMYNLLFFLPIYYQIVKQHSQINTSLLLLPQTLLVAPCGVVVYALVRKGNLSCHWVVLLGWLCTSGGIGLLAMLGMQKTVTADVLLNLLSGFGVGTLLPALTLSAKHAAHGASAQGLMVLTYIRYLGSASGLVVTGIVFQRVLRQNLAYTEFGNEATELTKHAMTLMYSIHDMPDSQNKLVLIQATQDTLRTIWIGLSILCAGLFLLSCLTTVIVVCRKETDKLVNQNSVPDSNRTSITKLDPVLITEFKHGFGDFNSDQFPKL